MADDSAAIAELIGKLATRIVQVRAGQTPPPVATALPAIDPRLATLAARAGLDPIATTALRLCAAADRDPIAYRDLLRLGIDATRPGVEVGALVTIASYLGLAADLVAAALGPEGRLSARGLLESPRDDGPLLARRVNVAPRVLSAIRGAALDAPRDLAAALEPAIALDRLVVAAGTIERVRGAMAGARAPWLAGARGTGKRTVLAALAAARGQRLIVIEYRDTVGRPRAELAARLWREAIVQDALVCIANVADAPNDPARAAVGLYEALIAAQVPVAFTSIPVPTLGDFEAAPAVVELRLPDGKTRVALWTRELPEVARLDEAAARYRLPPGRVIRVANAARDQARLDERAPTPLDVTRAVSAEVAQKVAVLGTRIDDAQTWDDVVLPAATMGAVQEIVSRARHRHRVLHEWGFERKLAKGLGLSALFAGPPGTGKTMVAGLIARELALELYQIDLSRVVSKYVGETEKNLAEVFDAADWGNVLLLFDEADALFSRRTDVKSSNDRFANMEINYLLQRLERFEGVSILTTNLEGSIDTAFKRRLSFRVGFPMPDASEREVLWRRMVPTEAPIVDLDVAELAQAYEFTGGNIRNAMLRAAYLAASEGAVITTDHVHRAVTLEYHDAGQLSIGGKLHQ